jgi:hypothetical protein
MNMLTPKSYFRSIIEHTYIWQSYFSQILFVLSDLNDYGYTKPSSKKELFNLKGKGAMSQEALRELKCVCSPTLFTQYHNQLLEGVTKHQWTVVTHELYNS